MYGIIIDVITITVDQLPTPSTPTVTFINISYVNISWSFDFSAVQPAQNVCFKIEYQNNTRYENVSSLICHGNHTFYIFPGLLRGLRYRFRVYATNGVVESLPSHWTFLFINGIDGNVNCIVCVRVHVHVQ